MKYLFSDLDGTLMLNEDNTSSGIVINETNLSAINEFNKNNVFGIATGRPLSACLNIVNENKINDLIVCGNGMTTYQNGEKLEFLGVDTNDFKTVINFAKENSLAIIAFEKTGQFCYYNDENVNDATRLRIDKYSKTHGFVSIFNIFDFTQINHVTFVFDDLEKKQEIIKKIDEICENSRALPTLTDSFDICKKNVSKLKAITTYLDTNNISHDNCGYVGDGFNDLDCLNYFKNSYVMENATDELKKHLNNKNAKIVKNVAQAIDIFLKEEK